VVAAALRNAKPKSLLITAGILAAIPTALMLLGGVAAGTLSGIGGIAATDASPNSPLLDLERRSLETYRDGTFGQIFVWRAIEWLVVVFFTFLVAGFYIEAMFLVGLYFGKQGIFQNVEQHLPLIKRGMHFGLGIGLPANLAAAWMLSDPHSPWAALGSTLLMAFGPVLTCGYVSGVVILAQSRTSRDRFSPLAAAGRMALSNYLTQSIVCTTLFYSYGFGLYGQVGAGAGVILSVAIWLIQLRVSVAWLRKFQFGPIEWLWRTLSYGRVQPMRIEIGLVTPLAGSN